MQKRKWSSKDKLTIVTDFSHSSVGCKTPCEFEQMELLKNP